jgi:hypothetical protein
MDAVLRFRELVRMLRASPMVEASYASFRHRVQTEVWDYRVKSGVGSEEIEFSNGSQLRIFAPAEDSLHGSVTDLVVIDEARFFDAHKGDGLMAAVLPTQATRDGQVWITSTAGGPESMFLARQMEIARASQQTGGHVALVEYGVGVDVPAGALLDAVWAAHPAAGRRGGPVREALAVAAEQMPAWQFAHEYGNRWAGGEGAARLLPEDCWVACEHSGPLPGSGRPVLAVDVPLDRSPATIVRCRGGVVEVVEQVPADAAGRRLVEVAVEDDAAKVAVDVGGPAGTVANDLQPIGDRVAVPATRDLTAASAAFYDAVLAGTARVRSSPVFDAAAASAERRMIGQAWTWSRSAGGSPLVAASLALWAEHRALVASSSVQDWTAF